MKKGQGPGKRGGQGSQPLVLGGVCASRDAKEAAQTLGENTLWTGLQAPVMVLIPGADHGVWAWGGRDGVNIQGVTTFFPKVLDPRGFW